MIIKMKAMRKSDWLGVVVRYGMLSVAGGILMLLTGCATIAPDQNGRSPVTEVTTPDQFDQLVLAANRPVLVIFHSRHCTFCKMALKWQLPGWVAAYRGKIDFVTVEIDQGPDLREVYGIRGVPAYLFFKNGELQKRITGYRPAIFIDGSFKVLLKP